MDMREIAKFRKTVWEFYHGHGRRDLPWRLPEANNSFDPYKILVSEIMLQQTQVPRVIPKYKEFLEKFPNTESLAAASLNEVLAVWNGLGYNRRAKFLWQAAQKVVADFGGVFPQDVTELQTLPGVGPNTAGAVMVYAFNRPIAFVETNIRTVFIHHFFKDQKGIPDAAIKQLVSETIDTQNPRTWFWALMDYGRFLKQTVGNLSRASKSYTKQSKFEGSKRQLRGQIIRMLINNPVTKRKLSSIVTDARLDDVLDDLVREGMVQKTDGRYTLFS
jgi:A/G-specific adenine glycosylase